MGLNGGTHLVVAVQTENLEQDQRDDVIEGVQKVLKARIDDFILAEAYVQRGADNRIVIQIPGIDTKKAKRIKEIIKKQAHLEFRLVVDEPESI